jgi:hypothetical protein
LTDEVCLAARDGVTTALIARCVRRERCIVFRVGGLDTNAPFSEVFRLIVQKHCEDPAASVRDRCALFARRLRDSIRCTKESVYTDDRTGREFFRIKCCFANDPPMVGRRLLTSDDLLTGSTNDPGATGSLTFTTEDESSASALSVMGLSALLFIFV